MIRITGFVAFLLGIWILLWGELSVANVASGLVVAVALLVVFPRARTSHGFVVRPFPTVRFMLFFAREMVESVVLLSREVLSPRSRVHTGVLAVPVVGCSGSLLAVIANLLALTPGTTTVEIETDPATLYVHVLIFRDIETVRARIQQLNRLVVLAFAPHDDRALPGGSPVITASLVVLALAAACFFVRLLVGPTLSDRVIAIDGMLVVGVSAIGVEAVRSGVGSFLPAALVVTLVGFLSTAIAARFIEERELVIGEAIILVGCLLTLLSAVGVLRFPDVFQRMHALTKASALGLILVLVGAALVIPSINDVTSLALAAFLQVLTLPVAANLISRATYRASGVPRRIDTVDELGGGPPAGGTGPPS